MADIQYDVLANLTLKGGGGQFAAQTEVAAAGADKLSASWDKIVSGGSALMGTLGGLVSTAAGIGTAAVGVLTGAAGLGVAYVGGAMAELEGKAIQLASVLAAATKTPFDVMERQSKALFDQFRADAVESAGETSDFVNVASKIGGPIMGAGKSMEDLHRITKGVVEMAPSLGIAFDQAGSDVMRMLQGTAGMESPLFAAMVAIPSLGIKKAEEFNKLDPSKRIAKLEEALTNPAFRAAASAYGNSWKGLVSTFEDVAKGAGMALGEPIFGTAKRGLAAFNKEAMRFVQNEGGLWLSRLGKMLSGDIETLGRAVGRLFPDFSHSGRTVLDVLELITRGPIHALTEGSDWISTHWKDIKSGAREASIYIRDAADRAVGMVKALGGGDLQEGLKRAGQLALAMKAAQLAAPVATIASGVGGLALNGGKALGGLVAGGGAAAATGAAGAAAAGVEAGAAGAAVAGATSTGATVAAGGGAIAAAGTLAIVLAAVGAAFVTFKMNFFGLSTKLAALWESIGAAGSRLWVSLGNLWSALMRLGEAIMPLIGLLGVQLFAIVGVLSGGVKLLVEALDLLANTITWLVDKTTLAINNAKKLLGVTGPGLNPTADTADEEKQAYDYSWIMPAGVTQVAAAEAENKKKPDPPKATTKVEVTLKWELGEGNEDAIYVKTRKDIIGMFREATGTQRTGGSQGL